MGGGALLPQCGPVSTGLDGGNLLLNTLLELVKWFLR